MVNVIALGSSFLCKAFVLMEFLPKSVLTIARVLPSYWYIKTNELLTGVEPFTLESKKPLLINIGTLIFFFILFIILTNLLANKTGKRASKNLSRFQLSIRTDRYEKKFKYFI